MSAAEPNARPSKAAVLRHHQASEALPTDAVNLYASEELRRAVDLIMNSYQTDFAVFDLRSFIGVLTRAPDPCPT